MIWIFEVMNDMGICFSEVSNGSEGIDQLIECYFGFEFKELVRKTMIPLE